MLEKLMKQGSGKTVALYENAKFLQSILETMVAFANTSGGRIILGVREKERKIIGIENPLMESKKIILGALDTIAPFFRPEVFTLAFKGKALLYIDIPHLGEKLSLIGKKNREEIWLREGKTNVIATKEALKEMAYFASYQSYDAQTASLKKSDIDLTAMKKALEKRKKKFSLKSLEEWGLIHPRKEGWAPSCALSLFYRKTEKRELIHLKYYAGRNKRSLLEEVKLSGDPLYLLDKMLKFIQKEALCFPLAGIKEACINALLHADYSKKWIPVSLCLFNKRLEIENAGGLSLGMDKEKALEGYSLLRNPVIGALFKELGLVQLKGNGMLMMQRLAQRYRLTAPRFEEEGGIFKTIIV